jgi:hypothetical protein
VGVADFDDQDPFGMGARGSASHPAFEDVPIGAYTEDNVLPFKRDDDGPIPVNSAAAHEGAPFPLVWYEDVHPVLTNNWLVKGVIPAEAFVTIIGHPGCGKSFMALDMALHVATGQGLARQEGSSLVSSFISRLKGSAGRLTASRRGGAEAWRRKTCRLRSSPWPSICATGKRMCPS